MGRAPAPPHRTRRPPIRALEHVPGPARRPRRAQPVRADHGPVRVVGERPRHLRVLLVHRAPPGGLAPGRHGRVPRRGAGRLPPLAALDAPSARPHRRPARPGARPGCRRHGQRRVAMARLRLALAPAVRAGEGHRAAVRRRPPRPTGRVDARPPAHAAPGRRGALRPRGPPDAPAQPRDDAGARRHRRRGPLRGRHTPPPAAGGRRRRRDRGLRPRPGRQLPAGTGALVPAPVGRSAQHRVPEHPVAGRRRLRWLDGGRDRREPGEVGVPAVRPHGLHLRHHRRGAGTDRGCRRRRPVRRALRARRTRRAARARSLRHAPGRRRHVVVRRAGLREHRRRRGHPPDHGRAAAVRVLRRLVAGLQHDRRGAAAERARVSRTAARAPPRREHRRAVDVRRRDGRGDRRPRPPGARRGRRPRGPRP